MTERVGRNEPCPCGSGRKYKQCCLEVGRTILPAKPHDGAVGRALDWLTRHHHHAFEQALRASIVDGLGPDEEQGFAALAPELWEMIHRNSIESLLAEGSIHIRGQLHRVSGLLFAPGGPLLTVPQRLWLEQLTHQPLKLYYVTQVLPGQQISLCDALDPDSSAVIVQEHAGAVEGLIGTVLGARVMQAGDHHELSGAVYPFSLLAGPPLIAHMQAFQEQPKDAADTTPGTVIRHAWLRQLVGPPVIPELVDAGTGEHIQLITDHYRVKDWAALEQKLGGQSDVVGDRTAGWRRLETRSAGVARPSVAINIDGPKQLSLFYRTQMHAQAGRPWFDALAQETVIFVRRETVDPEARIRASRTRPEGARKRGAPASPAPTISPEVLAGAIESAVRDSYAHWADEPLPLLQGRTPREAAGTAAGLERVKGLLRSYQAGEKEQAQQQHRRMISFGFLWEALGIPPE